MGLRKYLTAWNSIKCMISTLQVFTVADGAVDASSERCFNETVILEITSNYFILGALFCKLYYEFLPEIDLKFTLLPHRQ